MVKKTHGRGALEEISREVFTSEKLSLLVFKRPHLLSQMMGVFEEFMSKLKDLPNNQDFCNSLYHVLHDFKYMAKPECIKYAAENTDFI